MRLVVLWAGFRSKRAKKRRTYDVRKHDNHLFSNRVFVAFHRRVVSDLPDKNDSHSLTRSFVFTFYTFYIVSLLRLLLLLLLLLLLPSRINILKKKKFFHDISHKLLRLSLTLGSNV